MKYVNSLNLLQNELQNAVIQVLATDPANGKMGQIYYNSTHKALMQYDGAKWNKVGVVYQQDSTTGAVITGLDASGNVTTTNVTGLTLTDYTPVEGGYVTEGMTMEQAMQAMDTAIKNAVAGGGEVNQNAWSKISIPAQSTAATAVAGQAEDVVLSSDAKVDTFVLKTGNKWVDINGSGKTVNIGHSLSGAAAGTYGASNAVAQVTVDEAGHVTEVSNVEITPAAIGAATTAAVETAQAAAEAAQASADTKVASVTATENGGIEIGGTKTAPTVGIKLDPATGNAATLGAAGLMVTIPEVTIPVYDIVKDADSGDYAAIYHLTKDGVNTGAAINIPKDLFVKSGEIVDNPVGQPAGKYIKLTLQNQDEPIYINVADLVDAYTAGNGITISATNEISAKVVAANGLSVDTDGVKMALASATANGAMSKEQFTKLGEIADNATANTITLNGAVTADPTFYAPTTGGTAGQHLVSGGDGAPTWQDMPVNLKKYSANNTAITAAGGAYTWTIAKATHGINTPAVIQLYEVATNEMVMADVVVAATGDVTIKIVGSGTLAADKYKVVIIG
nr:MAG TPA: hypothetical protein [Caudoviricetes sp.]